MVYLFNLEGSKAWFIPYLRKLVDGFVQRNGYETFVEVFGGTGVISLSIDVDFGRCVYNDVNKFAVNLFKVLKAGKQKELIELLEIPFMDNYINEAKDVLKTEIQGDYSVKHAWAFVYLNSCIHLRRCVYNFNEADKKTGKKKNILARINNIERTQLPYFRKKLTGMIIENLDFEELIKKYDKSLTLFYVDSPYYLKEDYYNQAGEWCSFSEHERLFNCLKDVKGGCIVSYNNCKELDELYLNAGFKKIDLSNVKENEVVYYRMKKMDYNLLKWF